MTCRKSEARSPARDQARIAADYARRLQSGGKVNQLVVLDAQRTLASAELSLAQLQAGISDDQIAIFLALGGGWQKSGPTISTAAAKAFRIEVSSAGSGTPDQPGGIWKGDNPGRS